MHAIRLFACFAPLTALVGPSQGRPALPSRQRPDGNVDAAANYAPHPTPFGGQRPFVLPAVAHATASVPVATEQQVKKPALDRDFDKYPTLRNIPRLEHDLWLAGDVHGDYFRYTRLLEANGLIGPVGDDKVTSPYPPASAVCDTTPTYRWTGKDATLVQTGDVIDKGYWNTRLLHLHMNLEAQASESGGRFVMTLGNHELSFLREPVNGKTVGPGGLAIELWGCELEPDHFASDAHPMGKWLRRLPVAVRVGPVLAGHGGQTSSRSLDGLRIYWEEGLKRDGFATVTLNGLNSFLRARDFAGRDGQQGPDLVAALDPNVRQPVRHIVHAHNPEVGVPGKITTYGMKHKVPTLIDIDVGLTRLEDYSEGWLLHLFQKDNELMAEACSHRGKCHALWSEMVDESTDQN